VALPPNERDVPITAINGASASFDFLAEEPDIYTVADLKERHV